MVGRTYTPSKKSLLKERYTYVVRMGRNCGSRQAGRPCGDAHRTGIEANDALRCTLRAAASPRTPLVKGLPTLRWVRRRWSDWSSWRDSGAEMKLTRTHRPSRSFPLPAQSNVRILWGSSDPPSCSDQSMTQ